MVNEVMKHAGEKADATTCSARNPPIIVSPLSGGRFLAMAGEDSRGLAEFRNFRLAHVADIQLIEDIGN